MKRCCDWHGKGCRGPFTTVEIRDWMQCCARCPDKHTAEVSPALQDSVTRIRERVFGPKVKGVQL